MAYNNRKDYTMRDGKDAAILNKRHGMEEGQHDASNNFVKMEQNKLKSKAGHEPRMEARYSEFDACMINNGYHAQEFAKQLTAGLDKEAFPVKQMADKSQD